MSLEYIKIRILSESHSIKVQSYLFKRGFSWGGNKKLKHTSAPFLYTSTDFIHFGNSEECFEEDGSKEIVLPLKVKTLKD